MSGTTPLARKLGVREGSRVAVVAPPSEPAAILGPLPEGAELASDPDHPPDPPPPAGGAVGDHLAARRPACGGRCPGAPPGAVPGRRWDVLLLFARSREALEERLPEAVSLLDADGGLWVAWPKKSSELAGDLDREEVRRQGPTTRLLRAVPAGLVDNKVCAVDADWSALRFVYRLEDRDAVR